MLGRGSTRTTSSGSTFFSPVAYSVALPFRCVNNDFFFVSDTTAGAKCSELQARQIGAEFENYHCEKTKTQESGSRSNAVT